MVASLAGFGAVELVGELDYERGTGPVYLRLDDGQVWRGHHDNRPSGHARGGEHAKAVSRVRP